MKTFILKAIIVLGMVVPSNMQAQIFSCQASFTATVSPTGNVIQFTNTSSGNFTNVQWSFGDGTTSNATNPTHIYNSTGPVVCCLSIWDINGSCQSMTCDTILLGNAAGNCLASFSFQSTGSAFYFYGFTNNPAPNIYYSWTFGDGDSAIGQFPVHTYNAPGTYQVCLTTFNTITFCTDTFCQQITVLQPACQANFTYTINSFTNAATFTSSYLSNTATYLWDFNDGSIGTGAVINHTFILPGIYNVCLTVLDSLQNCSTTTCIPVTIANGATCHASFIYSMTPVFSQLVTFTDLSSGNPVNWHWDFGDGDTSNQQNPVHTYAQAGAYTICLTITTANGCTNTSCHVVLITTGGNLCNANYVYQTTGNSVTFYTNNTGYSHSWSFGDGTFSFLPNPTHTFGAPGIYLVCHTVYDSIQTCSATYCDSILISTGGNCIASFTYTVDSTGYIYSFISNPTGTSGNVQWSFGDGTGSSAINPTHQYTSAGVHIVCLTYTDPATGNILCSNCVTIVTGNGANPCVPIFYSFPDSNAIGNGNVHFGILNACLNMQYVWNFGDSTTGSGPYPTHVYSDSGWYYVCVTAFSPLGSYTFCDSVFSFRFTTSLDEAAAGYGLKIYPNPMAGNGTATFALIKGAHVTARISDMQGRVRSILMDETLAAGLHTLLLNTRDLQNGIYLLALTVNNTIVHQRISVMN